MSVPYVVEHYLDFCKYANDLKKNDSLDLSDQGFLHVTTALPLIDLISNNMDKYIPPKDYSISSYVDTLLTGGGSDTYLPLNEIPSDPIQRERVLSNIDRLRSGDELMFGGANSFSYVVGELIGNIFDHAQSTKAMVMGQKYQDKFTDLCFYDNGITIPESFSRYGYKLRPYQALAEAINGLSTRDESIRGFGLWSCTRICVEGLSGQVFIASGNACMHINKDQQRFYELDNDKKLQGTLISLRVYPVTEPIDITKYVE